MPQFVRKRVSRMITTYFFGFFMLLFAGYDYSSTEVIEVPDPPNLTTAGVNIQWRNVENVGINDTNCDTGSKHHEATTDLFPVLQTRGGAKDIWNAMRLSFKKEKPM
nr:PREDICTED: uncharacterized protein LOC109035283 [Bemisia tabaci]